MGIAAALNALVEIQESISIVLPSGEPERVKKAYKTVPAESDMLPTTPCVINIWSADPLIESSGLVEIFYDVRMQLFIRNAKQDVGADIANLFWDAFVAKFVTLDGKTLMGNISHSTLSGGSPTLVGWERAGGPYVGLDMHLNLSTKQFF